MLDDVHPLCDAAKIVAATNNRCTCFHLLEWTLSTDQASSVHD